MQSKVICKWYKFVRSNFAKLQTNDEQYIVYTKHNPTFMTKIINPYSNSYEIFTVYYKKDLILFPDEHLLFKK